jgi:hypothetical protein
MERKGFIEENAMEKKSLIAEVIIEIMPC